MTIRHLKIFIAVADNGSMRKAAEQLYISQPSVSQAIREVEEYYHILLFERLSKRLYITETGKSMLSYARHIVSNFETMEEAMERAGSEPKLRIGGSVTVGTVFMTKWVSELERQIPKIDVHVTVDNTTAIEEGICKSELDLAVVEGVVQSEDLISELICKDEIVMVVNPEHPFAGKSITMEMLNGQPLISREQGSADRNQFERLMTENNIHMQKKWCCTNTEAIKQAVISGKGIAILSKRLVEREVGQGLLQILSIKNVIVERDFRLITHKNKFFTPQMEAFCAICKKIV